MNKKLADEIIEITKYFSDQMSEIKDGNLVDMVKSYLEINNNDGNFITLYGDAIKIDLSKIKKVDNYFSDDLHIKFLNKETLSIYNTENRNEFLDQYKKFKNS